MGRIRRAVASRRAIKLVAGVVVGVSIGTSVPPEPVSLPAVGAVSGVAVGGLGLVAGAVLYLRGPDALTSSDCGCSGDCGCS